MSKNSGKELVLSDNRVKFVVLQKGFMQQKFGKMRFICRRDMFILKFIKSKILIKLAKALRKSTLLLQNI